MRSTDRPGSECPHASAGRRSGSVAHPEWTHTVIPIVIHSEDQGGR